MLKGSLSELSPFVKTVLLLALVAAFLLFSSLLGILLLVPFYGTGILSMLASPDYSNPAMVRAFKVLQIVNMTGGLLLPTLLYAWLTRKKAISYFTLSIFPGWLPVLLAAVLMLAAQPFIGYTAELNSQLKLPSFLSGIELWMRNSENLAQQLTDAFLSTTSLPGLAVNLFMIALLPAFCEELLFRGVLVRLFSSWTRNIHWGVIISSLIFAGIHLQFFGFLPRFLLGIVLGYLFYWSGSLWVPVTGHLINNLLSVLVEFLHRKGLISISAEQFGSPDDLLVVIISLLIFILILYYLQKNKKRQASDFILNG